jgi:competence protein ComEC
VANFCTITSNKHLGNKLFFSDKKIMILDDSVAYTNEKPDVLILINSPKINLERLFNNWKPQQVVVDGSNFKTYCTIWKNTCRKEKIPFHNTAEMGFYRL